MNRAFLTAFVLVLGASAASAGVALNGTSLNGVSSNGASLNGLSFNGVRLNGTSFNGLRVNGLSFNGLSFNGVVLNGTSLNGAAPAVPVHPEGAGDVAPVVVRAVTLADGTRLAVAPVR